MLTLAIPEQGQLVRVRNRFWLAQDVLAHQADRTQPPVHRVTLECLDDDWLGETLDVIWERELHAEMDQAVLNAYGWAAPSTAGRGVNLDHEFRGEGKEARYSLSEGVKEELLRRLLELNFEVAEQEAGMKDEGGGMKKKAGAKGKAKKSGGEESGSQLGLL
jgi:hypothetical protein